MEQFTTSDRGVLFAGEHHPMPRCHRWQALCGSRYSVDLDGYSGESIRTIQLAVADTGR